MNEGMDIVRMGWTGPCLEKEKIAIEMVWLVIKPTNHWLLFAL
jgi:hypothetical protein